MDKRTKVDYDTYYVSMSMSSLHDDEELIMKIYRDVEEYIGVSGFSNSMYAPWLYQ